jgi:hypothetical protein
MSEMRERVAGVFSDALARLQSQGHIEIRATADFSSLEIARAAIEAMREPTEAMLLVGPPEPYMDRDVWAKMINEALR